MVAFVFVIVAFVLYGVAWALAAISFLRPAASIDRKGLALIAAGAGCLVAALIAHSVPMGHFHICSRFDTLVVHGLAVAVAYLIMAARHKPRGMSLVVTAYIMLLLIGTGLHARSDVSIDPMLHGMWLDLHILTALVGYGLFALACMLAIGYLIQDHNLKHKRFGSVFHRLPSLETLDQAMAGQIRFAFVIFSLAVLSGVILAHLNRWEVRWITDPKTFATAATWLVYAVLFYLRLRGGYHGRRVALVTIGGFVCVLITFVGVNLLADSIHSFTDVQAAGGVP